MLKLLGRFKLAMPHRHLVEGGLNAAITPAKRGQPHIDMQVSAATFRGSWGHWVACGLSLTIAIGGIAGCRPFGLYDRRVDESLDDWESPQRNAYASPQRYSKANREAVKDKAAGPGATASPQPPANNPTATNPTAKPPAAEPHKSGSSVTAAKPNTAAPSAQPLTTAAGTSVAAAPAAAESPVAAANGLVATAAAPSSTAAALQSDKPTSNQTAAVAAPLPSAAVEPLQTPQQDLDVEAALAALPPDLQSVLRQQWLAAQGRSTATPTMASASAVAAAPSGTPAATSTAAPSTVSATAAPSGAAADSTANQKVRISFTDRGTETSAVAPPTQATAAATNSAAIAKPVAFALPADAAVVTASASLPVTPQEIGVAVASATLPLTPPAPQLDWPQARDAAITQLRTALAEVDPLQTPQQRIQRELALRMLYLSADRLDEALQPIEGLQADEQEYFRHQLQALYESVNPSGVPVASRRWAVVMDSQQRAMQRLAAVSLLQVRDVAFCTDVQGYGVVTPFRAAQFQADQDVLLYCELENVTAEQTAEGFETMLQGNYEIVDRQGNRVADQMLPIEKELCRNYRHDYFMVYRIFMPKQIAPGRYELRLTIEDMKGKKFGQSKLDFQIAEKPRT